MKLNHKVVLLISTFVVLVQACSPAKETVIEREIITEERIVDRLPQFDEERYERAAAMTSRNVSGLVYRTSVNAEWISDSVFWYRVNAPEGTEYKLVNAEALESRPLFDRERLASELAAAKEDSGLEPEDLHLSRIELDESATRMNFHYMDSAWTVNLDTYSLERVTDDRAKRPSASLLSPDEKYAAYIQDHNLWVRNMETGEDIRLTSDGTYRFGYATDSQGWTNSDRPILKWSGTGHMIATYQLDERKVGDMHLLRTADERPEVVSWPYALPGDEEVPMHHRVVIDVENRELLRLNSGPYHQRTSNCCGLTRGSDWADNSFVDENRKLAYVSTSRDYKEVTLKIADLETGEVREVYSERDEKFIETNLNSRGVPNWRVFYDEGVFVWFSRQSDWGHLYLHDLETGERLNSITEGEWNVSDILAVDQADQRIWFTAVGMNPDRDPYQEYVYSVKWDGSGLKLHTPDEGHHSVTKSPGGRFFVDTYSTVESAPVTVLRDEFGEVLMKLEEADLSRLFEAGWNFPEPFTAKARDGETDIYGLIFKPSDFDPEKSYPIINSIYPGPQIGSVGTRGFATTRRGQAQALAELGFIVVQVDALGTPMRSRSFHTAYYGDMSDNGLPDQIAAMKQLAERHHYIDIERAGMYGHSGGGFATAAALLNYPEFFKVGVAGAGNMDNRGYTFYWGEKFQGPFEEFEDGTDSFTNQALQLQVENLKGKLLISYGTMDNNVNPNTTRQLIDALIEHNKDFDLIVMPNRNHGYANEPYKLRRTWDYFVRHLLNMEPPKEFEL